MFRIISILLLFSFSVVHSQKVAIDTNVSLDNLVKTHLFEGCIEVSNVSSSVNGSVSNITSFGTFSKSNSNFPFSNGIILSTGNANSAGNTDISEDLNEGDDGWGTDPILATDLGISNSVNATSIEFDFTSAINKIKFEYILASEEYLKSEYICDNKDLFVLLIKEASSTGPYINIATVGSENSLIKPGNIHTEIFGFCLPENESYFDGYAIGDTNFEGRTTAITTIATIVPNTLYHAKLIIADDNDENFDTAIFLKKSIILPEVNLGKDVSTCATTVELNAEVEMTSVNFDWYLDDELVQANGTSSYTANETGKYTVKISIPLNGLECENEDSINVTLSSVQSIDSISDYTLCDANGDGKEFFDLSTKNTEVEDAAPPATYDISYHNTLEKAQADQDRILVPFENVSNPQVVYVRLEDETGCLSYEPINLIINPVPSIPDLDPFIVCDSDAVRNQNTVLGLLSFNNTIVEGDTNLGVSYHISNEDAVSGDSPLPMNYSNSSIQLFVRIFNKTTDCFNVFPIDIEVFNAPELKTEPIFLDACDPDHDGYASFNLRDALAFILPDLTGLTATFYTTLELAESGRDFITEETDYTNIDVREQLIYVRIENDITGCFSLRSFQIHTNLLLSETKLEDISFCDEDEDGMHTFSFDEISNTIRNMLPDLTITYYESTDDQDNEDPITASSYTFSGESLTLFIDIESKTCLEKTDITITLTDVVQFKNIPDQKVCDTNGDGFTVVDLSELDASITGGQSGFKVFYFETLSDAEENSGALNNYQNTSNPQTLYVRVTESSTACSDVSSFKLTVVPAPVLNTPMPIVICDNDTDGKFIINLEALIPTLSSSSSSLNFDFFTSLDNANKDEDRIQNPELFEAITQTVYIRAEETQTSLMCPVIIPLSIIVNTRPIIPEIKNYNICVEPLTNPSFRFNTKDAEILNNQSGKEVFYYEDASFTQLINKNTDYISSSLPQTIYVKVDNITDSNCLSTTSFVINHVPFPVYNPLTKDDDIVECDTDEIDGKIDIDLSKVVTKLTQGISPTPDVSFFKTIGNAENDTDPLPLDYENESNPQTIFIRIENSSNVCYLIESLGINILSTPKIEVSDDIVKCDTDYDGLNVFNLRDYEFDIFDVRQDYLVPSYFSNSDLNASSEITSLTAFQTTSNPQTIYIKVLNTATKCYSVEPLKLVSILPPAFNKINKFEICDNATDTFDLTEINNALTTETDIEILYFDSLMNAEDKTEDITNYNYQSTSTPIYVRVEKTKTKTNCFYIHRFNLIINPLPIANQPPNLEDCDDDFDGKLAFDLSAQTPLVLGSQDPLIFSVFYYKNMIDAEAGEDKLNSTHTADTSETIIAKITNTKTGCIDYTQFNITVHPLPILNIPQQVICLDDLPLIVSADTSNLGDTYLWSTNETTSEIIINEIGTYSVTVTTSKGCVNSTDFVVIISEAATIESIEVINFSDPNTVSIEVKGIGDYQFKIDDGPLQDSGFFDFVTLGYHTVTIVDLYGCKDVTEEILVINAQKFFTPNGDTYFDTWNIIGIETLPGSIIYVFDRYGKLLKKLRHNTGGWDGTYNGNNMPATDYWFLAKIKTETDAFDFKGHFALRR